MRPYQILLVITTLVFVAAAVLLGPRLVKNPAPAQASDCYAAGACAFEQANTTCEYHGKSYTCKACIWLATDAVSKYPDGSIFTNPSCKPSN